MTGQSIFPASDNPDALADAVRALGRAVRSLDRACLAVANNGGPLGVTLRIKYAADMAAQCGEHLEQRLRHATLDAGNRPVTDRKEPPMTDSEQTNPSPAHLVRVTHPDPEIGAQQVRLDVPDGGDPCDAARRWLADAHTDLRYLDAPAELVPDDTPDPVPAPAPDGTDGQGEQLPPPPPGNPAADA